MRIAVVGAGAIGGFLAAALARGGSDVAVVARGAHLDAIRRDGISVEASDLGAFRARVSASADLRELLPIDVAVLAFKSHQWPAFFEQLETAARQGATVVTMQNGVPFWFRRDPFVTCVDPGGRIGAIFPDGRTIGGVVHVSGHIAAPGCVRQSGGVRYALGATSEAAGGTAQMLAERMRAAGLAPEVTGSIRELVWLKLVNNVGLNPVSAMYGLTIAQMLSDARIRAEVRALMCEALAVGRALGVVDDVDIDARLAYAERLSDVRTSMLQDALAGRPLELDPIVGAVVELGAGAGVDTPRLRAAYDRLRSHPYAIR